jgi:hypothetical protein
MKKQLVPSAVEWKRRFQPHNEALKRLGLLAEITHDRYRWWRFLGNGVDQSGWHPGLLPAVQQRELLAYILARFPEEDLSGLKLPMRKANLLP